MRIMSIASGSSGNCIYISSDNTHILIDAGISRTRIDSGLKEADICLKDIDGVFLTHEHIDHIKGCGVLARKDGVRFFGTKGTLNQLKCNRTIGEFPEDNTNAIEKFEDINIGDLKIRAIPISHDATDPVCYSITDGKSKIGIITDLGMYSNDILKEMSGCNTLFVEANHDIRMLESGPYPYNLKCRIMGSKGHLSNDDSGKLISRLLNDNINSIYLGHLSKENNYDRLAFETVKQWIDGSDNIYRADDFKIRVASQQFPSELSDI